MNPRLNRPALWLLCVLTGSLHGTSALADGHLQYTAAFLGDASCPSGINELSCLAEAALSPGYYHHDWQSSADGSAVQAHSRDQLSWIAANQAADNLNLPQVQLLLQSHGNHWLFGAALSYQQYIWQGEATTLTFSTTVDFALSGGLWAGDFRSAYAAWIGAFDEIADDPQLMLAGLTHNQDLHGLFGDNQAYYNSLEDIVLSTDGGGHQQSLSFELAVTPGEDFYLAGVVISRAMNEGWVASDQSLSSLLSTTQLSDAELRRQLQIVRPPTAVAAPGVAWLSGLGLALMVALRRRQPPLPVDDKQ